MVANSFQKPKVLIFSDLDGTILSSMDYSPGPSIEAVQRAIQHDMELIIVSSKTRAEIESLQQEFHWNFPFIPENGGAIYLPANRYNGFENILTWDDQYWKHEFGANYDALCNALDEAANMVKIEIKAFHNLDVSRVAKLTDLPIEKAALAKNREYDEPFMVVDKDEKKLTQLVQKIQAKGFCYTRGGKFHHITSKFDKGQAVEFFINIHHNYIHPVICFAVGDALNDVSMFKRVDQAFLVRKLDSHFEQEAVLPNVTITGGIGPEGFAEAVEIIIRKTKT